MSKQIITQSILKGLLKYNPETGRFINLVTRRGRAKTGDIAGSPNNQGYINIFIEGVSYKAHRLAFLYMNGVWPQNQVDHINHLRFDNRWENLRDVTKKINAQNRSPSKNNTSGCAGVYWNKNTEKWHASIYLDGKNRHLGCFNSFSDAVAARKEVEFQLGYHINHNA